MITQLEPRLVSTIPGHPETGVLYVSIEYSTTVHLCACGCGQEVVLGISPDDWNICWDGRTVSINPSVGNWSLPCRSHYVIRHNSIRWARLWSEQEIARARSARRRRSEVPIVQDRTNDIPVVATPTPRVWRRCLRRLGL